MEHDDILWLAGLLEGEGWFGVMNAPWQREGAGVGYGIAAISLNMKDRDVVWRAAVLMGATRIVEVNPKKSHWSTTYQIKIVGQKATRVMMALLPHMGERRSIQIKDAIDHEAGKPERHQRGESNVNAKLTADQVRRIRVSGKRGVDIANELGVSQATVSLIRHRKTWPKVLDETPQGVKELVSSDGP